jgi:Secretion system C-terminal sorting domain
MHKLLTILTMACFSYEAANAQSCDTTKFEESLSDGWSAISYLAPGPFGLSFPVGYITGGNDLGYTQKANYFDLSATSYTYIQGAVIKFLKANSKSGSNLTRIVYFRVYEDLAGTPGALLGTAQKTLGDLKADVDAGRNTNINFTSGIALPASKKFYVAVDVSNLKWPGNNNTNDSLSVAATADDQVTPSTAWDFNKDDSAWSKFSENWSNPTQASNDLNVNLWIFPYVSTSAGGCGLLPVNLLSFNAARNNNDVTLSWEVSNEMNMQGYQIEKASNDGNFKSISFIAATNSMKNQTYTNTDRNAFATASTVQYRLKQLDADGSIKYSRTISLNHNAALTDLVFQNPFTGALQLKLNLSAAQKAGVQLYDMQGRVIAVLQPQNYAAGVNTIIFANTAGIKPGTYILKLNAGNEQMVYKVIKQ